MHFNIGLVIGFYESIGALFYQALRTKYAFCFFRPACIANIGFNKMLALFANDGRLGKFQMPKFFFQRLQIICGEGFAFVVKQWYLPQCICATIIYKCNRPIITQLL